jgi:hypothetical protein
MKKYILSVSLLYAVISLIILWLSQSTISSQMGMWYIITNTIYCLLSILLHFLLRIGMKSKSHQVFVKVVGVSAFLRIILSLLILVMIFIISEINIKQYVIGFIILYFVYMVFENILFVPKLRPDLERTQTNEDA